MSEESARWISEHDVVELLTTHEAVSALEDGLVREARGAAQNMVKTHTSWGSGNTLHAIGAAIEDLGVVGTKTWAHTSGGATPILLLFRADTGELLAIVEAFALGQFRTGAISGLATKRLAAPDADELSIIGTGRQAIAQVASVAAIRPLRRVRVFSPDASHCAAFAERVKNELGIAAEAMDSVRDAVDGSSIITLVTRAREPFLDASMVSTGAHVNAIGAIVTDRAEFDSSLLDRCAVITADSVAQARELSREFRDYFRADSDWERVEPLSDLVARQGERPAEADCTLLKAMGIGIADVALGYRCLQLASHRGLGAEIAVPVRATPRWRDEPIQLGGAS